jgi:pyruvate dehydrogenase E1 component alpha subunit
VLASELISFEKQVAALYRTKSIKGPIHLSGGNEDQLIKIFQDIPQTDWVFSSWRNHYHALLHGVPADELLHHLKTKYTMNLCWPEYRFYSSAIAGGILPIACGVAAGLRLKEKPESVHCFVGDMTAEMGIFTEVAKYVAGHRLSLKLYVEDNSFSTNTPTAETWPYHGDPSIVCYSYTRTWPHMGIGEERKF